MGKKFKVSGAALSCLVEEQDPQRAGSHGSGRNESPKQELTAAWGIQASGGKNEVTQGREAGACCVTPGRAPVSIFSTVNRR